ncbi:hypothetical protein F5876DRAFT_68586 [Lentinula aff. lateritia]|uniref:Uncharacterized protein n=1 Tax=Lentinula aff. lateritia TaxID=2804960 RepID=A0ACC1TQ58_9AGAR|nr:hypothetical protein F5876DRAFT_68586 [Lentinula aff. lateritia]
MPTQKASRRNLQALAGPLCLATIFLTAKACHSTKFSEGQLVGIESYSAYMELLDSSTVGLLQVESWKFKQESEYIEERQKHNEEAQKQAQAQMKGIVISNNSGIASEANHTSNQKGI